MEVYQTDRFAWNPGDVTCVEQESTEYASGIFYFYFGIQRNKAYWRIYNRNRRSTCAVHSRIIECFGDTFPSSHGYSLPIVPGFWTSNIFAFDVFPPDGTYRFLCPSNSPCTTTLRTHLNHRYYSSAPVPPLSEPTTTFPVTTPTLPVPPLSELTTTLDVTPMLPLPTLSPCIPTKVTATIDCSHLTVNHNYLTRDCNDYLHIYHNKK